MTQGLGRSPNRLESFTFWLVLLEYIGFDSCKALA